MSDREVTQQAEPVSHAVIAGAVFDFMGYLTSRKERITLSAADDAAPAVDAIRDFAIKRGLSLDDAQVREWIDALAQPVQEPDLIPQDKLFVCGQMGANITRVTAQPEQQAEPAACRFCHSKKGCWTWQCYHCGEIDDVQQPAPLPVQPEPVKLRRGDILRCIETDELCTVWATSTTNKTLIKWSANNFGNYTAEQIGELFWIEQQAKPMAWDKPSASFDEWWDGDRRRDNANPFQTDSFSYWAFEGWQAALAQTVQEPVAWLYPEGLKALQNGKCWTAYPTQHEDCNTPLYIAMPPMPVQRPWQGLTEQDMPSGENPMFDHKYFIGGMVYAAKVLHDKNHG